MAATSSAEALSPNVPALGPERPVVWPLQSRARLANGLEIALVESHTIPKFTGQLFFRSGNAAATAASTPGLAGITASVLRTGTTKRASQEIEEALRGMGADLSAGSSADTSVISFAGLADHKEPLLQLVAEIATQASFPEAEFERERRQLLEGLRIERTTPGFLAGERIRQVLFGSHPYATVAPTEAQVESYRVSQLGEFYRKYYRPENALLVIVGDFKAAEMRTQVERSFGAWQGAAPQRRPIPRCRRFTAGAFTSCTCRALCRRKSQWEIARSLARVPIGSAPHWRMRFTAARFIQGWC